MVRCSMLSTIPAISSPSVSGLRRLTIPRSPTVVAPTTDWVLPTSPGSRGSGRVRGFFYSGRVHAYVVTAISAMIHPLRKREERVYHGDCDSADQSRGPFAVGAGGSTQAQRGGAHRYLLSSAPSPCALVWPWRGGPTPGDFRWASCPV